MHHCHLGAVYLEQGEHDKGLLHAGEAARMAEARDVEHYQALALILMGPAAGRKGRSMPLTDAELRIRGGLSKLEELGLRPWEAQGHFLFGEMWADAGEQAKAGEEDAKGRGYVPGNGHGFLVETGTKTSLATKKGDKLTKNTK